MPTEKLYYLDPYLKTFTARVLSCDPGKNGFLVTLDRTAFYPEGGGQPCDLGTLGQAKVLDVQEKDGTVFHTVDRPVEIGAALPGAIDWDRRFDHMQQHSGEHIVSGMLCARFACDNVGFHMGEDLVTIDYNADIPWDALLEVEAAANRYLWEDHPVDIRLHRGEELSAIDYRSKKAIPGDVRIVTFPGADCCACCGTHVRTSAEVGLVKFLSVQKFRQGVRIELLCGGRAQRYLSRCWEQARAIGQALSVRPEASSSRSLPPGKPTPPSGRPWPSRASPGPWPGRATFSSSSPPWMAPPSAVWPTPRRNSAAASPPSSPGRAGAGATPSAAMAGRSPPRRGP